MASWTSIAKISCSRLRELKAKIEEHKRELEELDKNVYVMTSAPRSEGGTCCHKIMLIKVINYSAMKRSRRGRRETRSLNRWFFSWKRGVTGMHDIYRNQLRSIGDGLLKLRQGEAWPLAPIKPCCVGFSQWSQYVALSLPSTKFLLFGRSFFLSYIHT